jgi:hypothetical protein
MWTLYRDTGPGGWKYYRRYPLKDEEREDA